MDYDKSMLHNAFMRSRYSPCLRTKVGALAVVDGAVYATGYNHVPAGLPNCRNPKSSREYVCQRLNDDIKPLERYDLCSAIHAEVNLVLHAGGKFKPETIVYTTRTPCLNCFKILFEAGADMLFSASPCGVGIEDSGVSNFCSKYYIPVIKCENKFTYLLKLYDIFFFDFRKARGLSL